ncbi:MAG TPA: hypothetical protein VKD24_09250 [Candidatus Angelobacter sp.]|nr:hypothetical protein [Candidatus Angelobacter sp.]
MHTRLPGTGPLRARIVSNGALDPAAIREQEGVNQQSAAANAIRASFVASKNDYLWHG